MKYLLWYLVVTSGVNTVCVMSVAFIGRLEPVTPLIRAIDAFLTFGLGAWAFYLLATGF
jgi:hypothetical protein